MNDSVEDATQRLKLVLRRSMELNGDPLKGSSNVERPSGFTPQFWLGVLVYITAQLGTGFAVYSAIRDDLTQIKSSIRFLEWRVERMDSTPKPSQKQLDKGV